MVKKTKPHIGKGKQAYDLMVMVDQAVNAGRHEMLCQTGMGQLGARVFDLLAAKIRRATDRELRQIPEIGKARLAQIRKATA